MNTVMTSRYVYLFMISMLYHGFCYSQSIYHKDQITVKADSLHENEDFEAALNLRKQLLDTAKNYSSDYTKYIHSKYYHTLSCMYEFKSYSYYNPNIAITKKKQQEYLDSALMASKKAKNTYVNITNPDQLYRYNLQNRIYHQTAYLGNWKEALLEAKQGYEIVTDTLNKKDKKLVDLIYDIGYIYSQLGDYSKAIENFETSLELYKNIIGENHTDVAQAYNNIAVEYRNLGLKKKELAALLKAKSIWENLNATDDYTYLYVCYGNLFEWYSYYGDFENAEEYILKKDKLRTIARTTPINGFLRNKEEIYKDKLSEWYYLMLHYSRKKDTIKTITYADTLLKTINPDQKLLHFEVTTLSATLKLYASLTYKNNHEKAMQLLDKAIAIQETYKPIFYSKSFPYQLYKAELLVAAKKYSEAKLLFNHLNGKANKEAISNRFKLAILNAKTAQEVHETENAKKYFDAAFSLLYKGKGTIENSTLQELKPLISFETIEGFLAMGDFYFQRYKKARGTSDLKKATHRYLLAADIYHQLYLGQGYNEHLFSTYNTINKRLLAIGKAQEQKDSILVEIINRIEDNGSKLIGSKFVFNSKRQLLHISENFINQEENIKAQLNFYQKALLNSEGNANEKNMLWKDKIYDLKNDLSKIEDSIKDQHKRYYQFTIEKFDVKALQKSLKKEELVIKYIVTDTEVYAFLISKNTIKLSRASNKEQVLATLEKCLHSIQQRKPHYQESFREMKKLVWYHLEEQGYKKITIVPDGPLHYFPFEVLLLHEKMPTISYASSLVLYQEQKSLKSPFENLKVGAFSASNNNSKLPKVSAEIQSILKIFDGKVFLNASKSAFLENANTFNVLHLAMHSQINPFDSEYSSLNFFGKNDNQLFISDLYHETFKANMAVLSACDTGNGSYKNGEGVMSLSRAFNYAGVPSTVMSLWKVDDKATASIMSHFYKHLNQGETKDEAIKNAKIDYLNDTDDALLKHPYYWAGFVITGNTDPLVKTTNLWSYLFIVVMMALGIFRKRLFQLFKK